MTKWQKKFNRRIKRFCKVESGKSEIKVGDMRQALINFAIEYSKNPDKEHMFLMELAKRHSKRKK